MHCLILCRIPFPCFIQNRWCKTFLKPAFTFCDRTSYPKREEEGRRIISTPQKHTNDKLLPLTRTLYYTPCFKLELTLKLQEVLFHERTEEEEKCSVILAEFLGGDLRRGNKHGKLKKIGFVNSKINIFSVHHSKFHLMFFLLKDITAEPKKNANSVFFLISVSPFFSDLFLLSSVFEIAAFKTLPRCEGGDALYWQFNLEFVGQKINRLLEVWRGK